MKFLCLCYYHADDFSKMTEADLREMGEICAPRDKELHDSGYLRLVGSLAMPDVAKTIHVSNNDRSMHTVDDPFTSTPFPLGAFFIIEADSLDEATKIAALHPGAHIGHLCRGAIEVRPIDGFDQPQAAA